MWWALQAGAAVASYGTPFVGLPLLYYLGEYGSFMRASLVVTLFHSLFLALVVKPFPSLRSLASLVETPAMVGTSSLLYAIVPTAAVSAYSGLLHAVEPAVLVIEGVQMVALALYFSRMMHSHIATSPVRAKTAILVVSFVAYALALVVFARLLSHANISVTLSVAISAVLTLSMVLLGVTIAVERGIISDAALLALFMAYICWMAVEVSDDVQAARGSTGVVQTLRYMFRYLVERNVSLTASFAPLLSVELLLSVGMATMAIVTLPLDLDRAATVPDQGACGLAAGFGLAPSFVLVYTQYLSCSYGFVDGTYRVRWRFIQAAVGLAYYTYRMLRFEAE
ncbi:uncharacterized protein AMSG_07160 [Thecamonas trahens ATCC 50062]|uniref:Uncharacterized protein n=1 Tax=Thecamonas trahens ATCC 50062 TaxID=461836 RepID=A0A0L0DHZ2_THETB|nr:hypothetical protein AMSG_07160 [Thecamonas trahens ATCC 50062]KNC50918.1 hypothetical protein AMSG_07160 [Thecamonas trahens ATCC 50062]|eukprot:XP_013756618.1 hypothetical protein AMSG_07160 [Thecamonas trahens ATCC 50062]